MFERDYLLFNAYNTTLWNNIENEKQSFYSELTHFRKILKKIYNFCSPVKDKTLRYIKWDKDITPIVYSKKKLVISESAWNKEFTWDTMDCLLSYVDKRVLRGIFIERQHPGICNKHKLLSPTQSMRFNELRHNQFTMSTAFCDRIRVKYNLPLAVLSSKGCYDLFS